MTDIQQRIALLRRELPDTVELVAVSKFHPADAIADAYGGGTRVFGESRAQELVAKRDALPDDIRWHFIGHLQPNKVKYIAPFISLIHAVDTPRLLEEINKQALRCQRVIPCLLQLHVAQEETKFGFSPEELDAYLASGAYKQLAGVSIDGVMCMASNTDDEQRIRHDFQLAGDFFRHAHSHYFAHAPHFRYRSWGMTHDYRIAVEEGSNMVRIGTRIFGQRQY